MKLIDTHTHFDVPEYHDDYQGFIDRAYQKGMRHVVLIGYLAQYFDRMATAKATINRFNKINAHLAFGLHPLYIREHCDDDLLVLENFIKTHHSVAIGEIGLDTYPDELKSPDIYAKQQRFFSTQIELAKAYQLPIILHIRKAHADVLKLLKASAYQASDQGGVAHSFSGGVNEALAFVAMGFKLGITGQITNPNAKKLRTAVQAVYDKYGLGAFVIETDCPDMMPVSCQHLGAFNEPANLPFVLDELATLLAVDKEMLAYQLWQNSCQALNINLQYAKGLVI